MLKQENRQFAYMATDGLISVIVPSTYVDFMHFGHRMSNFLRRCRPPPHEVISVISGVPENSHLPNTSFDKIIIYHSILCQARSKNLGSSIASGRILDFLDIDDLPHPQRFRMISIMLSVHTHISAAVFFCKDLKHKRRIPSLTSYTEQEITSAVHHIYTRRDVMQKMLRSARKTPEILNHSEDIYDRMKLLAQRRQLSRNSYDCCYLMGRGNGLAFFRRSVFQRFEFSEQTDACTSTPNTKSQHEDVNLFAELTFSGYNVTVVPLIGAFVSPL